MLMMSMPDKHKYFEFKPFLYACGLFEQCRWGLIDGQKCDFSMDVNREKRKKKKKKKRIN